MNMFSGKNRTALTCSAILPVLELNIRTRLSYYCFNLTFYRDYKYRKKNEAEKRVVRCSLLHYCIIKCLKKYYYYNVLKQ